MCTTLEISRSGYYSWIQRGVSDTATKNGELLDRIREIHESSDRTYGSPRVHEALVGSGNRVGRNRVARLMGENGIRSKIKKRYRKPYATDSNHKEPVFSTQRGRRKYSRSRRSTRLAS